jgi:hypothetical protein
VLFAMRAGPFGGMLGVRRFLWPRGTSNLKSTVVTWSKLSRTLTMTNKCKYNTHSDFAMGET